MPNFMPLLLMYALSSFISLSPPNDAAGLMRPSAPRPELPVVVLTFGWLQQSSVLMYS